MERVAWAPPLRPVAGRLAVDELAVHAPVRGVVPLHVRVPLRAQLRRLMLQESVLAFSPPLRAGQTFLITSQDSDSLKKQGFKMRVDDVAGNIWAALPAFTELQRGVGDGARRVQLPAHVRASGSLHNHTSGLLRQVVLGTWVVSRGTGVGIARVAGWE